MISDKVMWWGYLHQNGTVQLKRWFGDKADYIDDCVGNPFVLKVVEPFEADGYTEAMAHLTKCLTDNEGKL